MADFSRLRPRHTTVNERCEEWARWVKVRPHSWAMAPMFRGYQSKAKHWEVSPAIRIEINTIAALEIEKTVSVLPEKHRDAIRWMYVFKDVPIVKMRQALGVSSDGLRALIDDGLDMVKNRLRII